MLRQSAALAVVALDAIDLVGGRAVDRVHCFRGSRLTVQDDIRLLQNPPRQLIDEQIKLSRLLDAPAPAQFYVVRGETAEAVLQREEALKQRLEPLIEKKSSAATKPCRTGCRRCAHKKRIAN